MGQSLVGRNHYALVKNYNKKKSHVFYRLSSPNYYKIFDDIIFSHFAKHTIKKPNNQNTEGLRASDFFVWLLIAIYPYRFGQLVSIHNLQPLSTIPILRYLKNVKVPSVMFDTKTQLLFDVVYTVSSTTSVPLPLRTCEQISTVNLDTLDAALTQHTPSRIVGFDTYVQTDKHTCTFYKPLSIGVSHTPNKKEDRYLSKSRKQR